MFCAPENGVTSVHVNQKETDLFLQNILGLMDEREGEFLSRKILNCNLTSLSVLRVPSSVLARTPVPPSR